MAVKHKKPQVSDSLQARIDAVFAQDRTLVPGTARANRVKAAITKQWNSEQAKADTTVPESTAAANFKKQLAAANAQIATSQGGNQQTTSSGQTPPAVRDYTKEVAAAPKLIYSMKDSERLQLANALKKAGYSVPTNGKYSDKLVAAYQQAVGANQIRNTQLGLTQPLSEFLVTKAGEVTGTGSAGTGKANPILSSVIYDPTRAAAYINAEFQSVLNRDATQKELTDLTGQLIAAQKANPTKITTDANGNQVQTGGLDATQFLDTLIKKTPAYMAKVAGKASTQLETVLATAKANGLDPTQAQIDAWTARVKNGEDPNTISHEIRGVAGLGQPDSIKKMLAGGTDLGTIYSPYKQYMSQILEIPADQIALNDPSLRMAIGPDKEMTITDYQNALRKDNRWQYTKNAKDSVASTVQRVLQDFGFMG